MHTHAHTHTHTRTHTCTHARTHTHTHTHTAAKGKQLPKGIYLSTAELSSLTNDTNHTHLHQLDHEVEQYRETIQSNKQHVVWTKDSGGQDTMERFRPPDVSPVCILSSYIPLLLVAFQLVNNRVHT